MTLFEYLAIAFGLLFSVAALRLLGGIPYAVPPARRYWVHLSMSGVLLLSIAASFWTFWSLRNVDWTFPRFLLSLGIPGLLYFCAAMIIPENPEDVESWEEHYYLARKRFFAGFGLWGAVAAISATVNLSVPLSHPSRLIHAVGVGIGVVGLMSSDRRVHAGIVIGLGVLLALWGVTGGLLPGWLAP